MLFISNLKKAACASKRDVLELATLQYVCAKYKNANSENISTYCGFVSVRLKSLF